MKKVVLLVCMLTLWCGLADAQVREGGGRGGFDRSAMIMPMIVPLADADASGEVTLKEWQNFVDSVKGEEGKVATASLKQKMQVHTFDADRDGKLEIADLETLFAQADRNSDGILQSDELGGRRRGAEGRGRRGDGEGRRRGGGGDGSGAGDGTGGGRAGGSEMGRDSEKADAEPRNRRRGGGSNFMQRRALGTVWANADTNSDREVTAEEWTAFKSTLGGANGEIGMDKLNLLTERTNTGDDEGGFNRRRGGMGRMIDGVLETLTVEQLESTFTKLDRNEDQILQADELRMRRGGRGEGQGRGGNRGRGERGGDSKEEKGKVF